MWSLGKTTNTVFDSFATRFSKIQEKFKEGYQNSYKIFSTAKLISTKIIFCFKKDVRYFQNF